MEKQGRMKKVNVSAECAALGSCLPHALTQKPHSRRILGRAGSSVDAPLRVMSMNVYPQHMRSFLVALQSSNQETRSS